MDISIQELARRQLKDFRNLTPGTYFGEEHPPLALREAYAVQGEVARLRALESELIGGYKLGCLGPKIRQQFGMDGPIRGVIFGNELHASGVTLSCSNYADLAIEGEMALRIGAGGEIVRAFPVVELHNFVFRAKTKTLQELIVNNGLNAGAVLPTIEEPIEHWNAMVQATVEISINGKLIDTAGLWGLPGGSRTAVEWLQHNLAESGLELRPGQIVLTGTVSGLYRVNAGDHVRVTAANLRTVDLHLVA